MIAWTILWKLWMLFHHSLCWKNRTGRWNFNTVRKVSDCMDLFSAGWMGPDKHRSLEDDLPDWMIILPFSLSLRRIYQTSFSPFNVFTPWISMRRFSSDVGSLLPSACSPRLTPTSFKYSWCSGDVSGYWLAASIPHVSSAAKMP